MFLPNLLVFGLILAFLVACSSGEPLHKAFGKSYQGWLCFESGNDIWIMRTDGSQLQNITNTDSVAESNCKISWDTQKILYTDSDQNLFVINRNGTGKKLIAENMGVTYPSWSPDNSKIVYSQTDYINETLVSSIHLIDTISYKNIKVFEMIDNVILSPVLSPDGTKIAFIASNIYITNLEGTEVEQIKEPLPDEMINQLSWSRDGKKIAFSTTHGVPYGAERWAEFGEMYALTVEGGLTTQLTDNSPDRYTDLNPGKNIFGFASSPCWTNKDEIIFLSNGDSHSYNKKPYIKEPGGSAKILLDQEMVGMDYQPDSNSHSTPVPTIDNFSSLEEIANARESATAQAIEANCGNAYTIPVNSDWQQIVCDKFDEDNGNWWVRTEITNEIKNTFNITDHEYLVEIKTGPQTIVWLQSPDEFSDLLVTTTLRYDSDSDDANIGLALRGKTANGNPAYLYVLINSVDQTYYVGSINSTRDEEIRDWKASDFINVQGPNQLSVKAEDMRFTIYINGEAVDQFYSSQASSGRIGIIFNSPREKTTVYHIDNFLLCAP